MLFYLSLLAFTALLVMRAYPLLLYRYRAVLPLPLPDRLRAFLAHPAANNYAPLATFAEQAGAGLTSAHFDIEADNIREGDVRAGLDEQGTRDVMEIMRRENVNFDQARLIRHNRYLAANGIDPSGMPLDAKAVTRL
ncbi:hypothetical protein FA95DRAFT_1582081 [Auriscalpium vulgare]|uniref:Uncharacterized protein n=1 Tax=Auriscalpium vulgare TaxID=40419 RepID=A0ACB8RX41_9AGAM|nr:hypothetical protein FA95DRAFT_1582081 [Auriscalpium vulgare]